METHPHKKKKSGYRPENVRIAKPALGILGSTQESASSSTRPQPPQPHLPSLLSFLSLLLQLSKLFTLHLLSEGHQETMAAHARVELAEPTKTSQHVIGLPMTWGYIDNEKVVVKSAKHALTSPDIKKPENLRRTPHNHRPCSKLQFGCFSRLKK